MIEDYWESDRRLWLTQDRKELVEDGDERAAVLYTTPGKRIPMSEAIKFKLVKVKKEKN